MATTDQVLSANQQFQKGQKSLEDSLKLLVNENFELEPKYLDLDLIGSMKANWPKNQALPLVYDKNRLFVACPENANSELENHLKTVINNFPITVIKIKQGSWDGVVKFLKEGQVIKSGQLGAALAATIEDIEQRPIDATDEKSVGNEVRNIISEAAGRGASDIHFEPIESFLIVRFRIDGVLRDVCKYRCTTDADYRKIILARIKIIANLNIAEARIPQDGRVTETIRGKKIDLRVSTLPCLHGEKCVIRLLPHEISFVELTDLGMPESVIPRFESWLKMSQGMVLITGPTGSGKTSTLYTSLAKVLDISKNVVTVEDPVEYQLARVNQVQVNVKAGLTFASGLRSILRQDPDIVMIGEIRDQETAEIAIQAALTGHLVLSTLHTNDAPSSISRLIDMGVEPYLVSSALVGIMAQRLLRKICSQCCIEYEASDHDLATLDMTDAQGPVKLVKANGCQNCNNTGYSGREGIFEIMPVNEKMKVLIQENAGLNEIKKVAKETGMDTLFESGVAKVLEKKTTIEELLRVVPKKA